MGESIDARAFDRSVVRRRLIYIGSLLLMSILLEGCKRREGPIVLIEPEPSVEGLISIVQNGGGTFQNVPFGRLVEISTGKRVVPIDPSDQADVEIIDGIAEAADRVLVRLSAEDSPARRESRINEVSTHFEAALLEEINRLPELECSLPRTAEGNLQRAGYPDLMIRHRQTGRIVYLDPKLVKEGTMSSDLRTFYFTPSVQTKKVLFDASHLLIGFEHDGNTQAWKFLRWHLVDLSSFRVRLKAEFQASNRDLYQPELIISTGDGQAGPSNIGDGGGSDQDSSE